MYKVQKDRLLDETLDGLGKIISSIEGRVESNQVQLESDSKAFYKLKGEDVFERRMAALEQGRAKTIQTENLQMLVESPYFARVDIEFEDENKRPYYIGKFASSEDDIYSWITPIASLRFENPGLVEYETRKFGRRNGELSRKDQYMINHQKLLFMTSEGIDYPRELIYQEHFSTHKEGFVLPEIVAQMEKAQDMVIRAEHNGPLMISGPAGSGKTTLALHRIAYLRQAPETAPLYPAESILVFVQDTGTKDYFSHLLPELGIHDVKITTFADWALHQLQLGDYSYIERPGETEIERYKYEFAKLKTGSPDKARKYDPKMTAHLLSEHYRPLLSARGYSLLQDRLKNKELDRHDLTTLLEIQFNELGSFVERRAEEHFLPQGKVRTTYKNVPMRYAMIMLDEFQNYLPIQLKLLRSTLNPNLDSILYIGDIAQQTQLGTIRTWDEFDGGFSSERHIYLEKVYRNTATTLKYIQALGYKVDLPEGLRVGEPVIEADCESIKTEILYIEKLRKEKDGLMGILALDDDYLEPIRKKFKGQEKLRISSFKDSQGVEFETVVIVGIHAKTFVIDENLDDRLRWQIQNIYKDLLYVALTRSMDRLYVLGKGDLKEYLRLTLR